MPLPEPYLPDFLAGRSDPNPCPPLCWRRVQQKIELTIPGALATPAQSWQEITYEFLCQTHNAILCAHVARRAAR